MHLSAGEEWENQWNCQGRTHGNPDGGLWAADVAHFVWRPDRGGAVAQTEIKEVCLKKRVCLENFTTECLFFFFHYQFSVLVDKM